MLGGILWVGYRYSNSMSKATVFIQRDDKVILQGEIDLPNSTSERETAFKRFVKTLNLPDDCTHTFRVLLHGERVMYGGFWRSMYTFGK